MFLSIKNLGKIAAADIDIAGITVIAGENNTGKSTVGKALFSVFNSFYQIDKQIYDEKLLAVINQINRNSDSFSPLSEFSGITKSIMDKKDIYINDMTLLQQDLKNLLMQYDALINIEKLADNIIHIFNISDYDVLISSLRNRMRLEFNMQINNLYCPEKISDIMLIVKGEEIKIQVTNNENIDILFNNISLNTEVVYIDSPYVMDNPQIPVYINSNYRNHRDHLSVLLTKNTNASVIDEIIASKKLNAVFEKLNSICSGEMIKNNNLRFAYKESESGNIIDVSNISTGLKTFAIIKTLLLNGSLVENGTIILDEPEIHLHPKWQLVFAEIIVLLQKEFNMHILINTHSPYFLDAIEVYSLKHGITGKCKYYLAEISNNGMSEISDVSDNIERIYKKLAEPFQILEDESYDY